MEPADAGALPAYVCDLADLDAHMANVRAALGDIEVCYAVKANHDPKIAPYVDGVEVSSVGELAHVRTYFPDTPIALGGPGKTDAELFADVTRLHIESPSEIRRLFAAGRCADVLLRVNLDIAISGASLAMGGGATPFGMDPPGIFECLDLLAGQDAVRLRGIHAHLASGLDARPCSIWRPRSSTTPADSASPRSLSGAGMAMSYADPDTRFDWKTYGEGLAALPTAGRDAAHRAGPLAVGLLRQVRDAGHRCQARPR